MHKKILLLGKGGIIQHGKKRSRDAGTVVREIFRIFLIQGTGFSKVSKAANMFSEIFQEILSRPNACVCIFRCFAPA